MGNKKLLITGGHASATVYAVKEEIDRQKLSWDLVFVGAKTSLEGKKTKTLAEINFNSKDVKTYFLNTGRIQRKFSLWTVPSLVKIPLGFVQALFILLKEKPQEILSFGGFVAYPIVFWGYFFRIPIILHEQTSVAGRGNVYSARFATKIALARESSRKYFPENKCLVTGNPISFEISKLKPKTKKRKTPLIFVHGGQTGSSEINDKVAEVLEKILLNFQVIHQTGENDRKKLELKKSKLPPKSKKRYQVVGIIESKLFHKYLKNADIVISRSGANITSELMVVKTPSILIPLPYSYLNEQEVNAKTLEKIGIAKVISQGNLSSEKLLLSIKQVNRDWYNFIENAKSFDSPDKDASKKLVGLVKKYL